jgi:hypothetical protein
MREENFVDFCETTESHFNFAMAVAWSRSPGHYLLFAQSFQNGATIEVFTRRAFTNFA